MTTEIHPPLPPSGNRPPDRFQHAPRSAAEWLAHWRTGEALAWHDRCQERWIQRAILVDLHSLEVRSLARLAFERALDDNTDLSSLMTVAIDRSIDDLQRSQEHATWSRAPQDPASPLQRYLVDYVGVPAAHVYRAVCAFNACTVPARAAFFACCLGGQTLEAHAAQSGVPVERIEQLLGVTLEALGVGEGGNHG